MSETIRARVKGGVLEPLEPLGEMVSGTILFSTRCATLQAAINVATVPDPDHQNNQPNILD